MEKTKLNLHNSACKLLGIGTDKIRLVSPGEFKEITGHGVSTYLGVADYKHHIYYIRRGEPLRTYVHEILHLLFQHRPHWWIYATSWKLTGLTHNMRISKNYGYGNGFRVEAQRIKEIPPKAKIIKLAQQAYHKLEKGRLK